MYVVHEHERYEGSKILGVFTTAKAATAFRASCRRAAGCDEVDIAVAMVDRQPEGGAA